VYAVDDILAAQLVDVENHLAVHLDLVGQQLQGSGRPHRIAAFESAQVDFLRVPAANDAQALVDHAAFLVGGLLSGADGDLHRLVGVHHPGGVAVQVVPLDLHLAALDLAGNRSVDFAQNPRAGQRGLLRGNLRQSDLVRKANQQETVLPIDVVVIDDLGNKVTGNVQCHLLRSPCSG